MQINLETPPWENIFEILTQLPISGPLAPFAYQQPFSSPYRKVELAAIEALLAKTPTSQKRSVDNFRLSLTVRKLLTKI
jgi:hypothetical protein